MHLTAAGSAPTTRRRELASMPETPQRHSCDSLVLGHAAPLGALLLARPGGVVGAALALLLCSHRLFLIALRLLACRGIGLGQVGVKVAGPRGVGQGHWGRGGVSGGTVCAYMGRRVREARSMGWPHGDPKYDPCRMGACTGGRAPRRPPRAAPAGLAALPGPAPTPAPTPAAPARAAPRPPGSTV